MIVLDSSAALAVLVSSPPNEELIERVMADGDLHAPHLIDVEVVHALRRLVHQAELTPERADLALVDFGDLAIVRYPHADLRDRMWELRENLTAYDAAFVALSEVLDVPLLTTDHRLSRSPAHHAYIEVY